MNKEVLIMPVHGMGDEKRDFDKDLKRHIQRRLGVTKYAALAWQQIYYQDLLYPHEARYFRAAKRYDDLDWMKLRRFVLFGFADAAAMERQPQKRGSTYEKIQRRIVAALDAGAAQLHDPKGPVIIVAHSLGGQVVSNFIWDAQDRRPEVGIFRPQTTPAIGRKTLSDRFRRLRTLRHLCTTGCNIPIFVAGIPVERIKPVKTKGLGWSFEWMNFYDPDDVLGWPLKPLSPAYRREITGDYAMNAGGNLIDWFKSWTPLSHNSYWGDDDFLDPFENALREFV